MLVMSVVVVAVVPSLRRKISRAVGGPERLYT